MNQDSQYETQPSQKKEGEKKKGRQEQTSKLQIKECEMQRRIADPYRARGRGGREGISACVGGGGMCLLSQNTEPRGEPLMAERDMSTFRMGGGAAAV